MLFNNIEDLKKFIPVGKNFRMDDLKPILENDSEPQVLVPLIGQALYDDLNTKVSKAEVTVTGKLAEVLKRCRYIIANHAMNAFVPSGRVTITNGGVVVSISDDTRSASAEQIGTLREQYEKNISNGIEDLYKYLEDNMSDAVLDLWKNSDAFTLQRSNFINTAVLFNQYVFISSNRTLFQKLRPIMSDVEQEKLIPVLGQDFYDTLKTKIKNGTLTSDEKRLMPFIWRIVAKGTAHIASTLLDLNITSSGLQLRTFSAANVTENSADRSRITDFRKLCSDDCEVQLQKLKDFLDANHNDYEEYEYVAPDESASNDINTSGSGVAMF